MRSWISMGRADQGMAEEPAERGKPAAQTAWAGESGDERRLNRKGTGDQRRGRGRTFGKVMLMVAVNFLPADEIAAKAC